MTLWYFLGSEKAFAAGADIKEMQPLTYVDCYSQNLFSNWVEVARLSKPVSLSPDGRRRSHMC